jgi:predicted DNA-binding antitoxin AbrB/MazE fold protein
MKETLDAIYENGVLIPMKKLSLPDGRKLRITLETNEDDEKAAGNAEDADLSHLAGSLKGSPLFEDNPLAIQKRLRDEWT